MSGEVGNPHTGLEIGKTLELTREKRGLSLQQVEEATKIRTRYLRDLENENFDVLPAVYVLGSLKTYAEHLGLDGAAMTGELKRRQAPLQAEQDEALKGPPSGEPRGLLASLARLIGIGETAEDEAGTMSDPGNSPGLYVSLAVVLVFILATYLASSLRGEDPPSVSQVREPKISQSPSGVAMIGNVAAHEPNTEDGNKENQPEHQIKTATKDARVGAGRSERLRDASQAAQASSSATASAGAPTSASASASAAPAASAPATAKPVPVVRPKPVAKKEPVGRGRRVAVAPNGRPAQVPANPRIRETKVITVGANRLNNRSPTRMTKIIKPAR
jgi:cytoskeletal protein RodZ